MLLIVYGDLRKLRYKKTIVEWVPVWPAVCKQPSWFVNRLFLVWNVV